MKKGLCLAVRLYASLIWKVCLYLNVDLRIRLSHYDLIFVILAHMNI